MRNRMDTYVGPATQEKITKPRYVRSDLLPSKLPQINLDNPKSIATVSGIGLALLWLLMPRLRVVAIAGLIGLGIWYVRNK